MSARIRIYGKEAVFEGGQWRCDDDSLQAMLQSMVDPRHVGDEAAEHEHALYCAGRFGGLIHSELGWEVAPHPEPEIRMEDLVPEKPERGGLLGLFRRKR